MTTLTDKDPWWDVSVKDEGTHLVLTAFTPVARDRLLTAGSVTIPLSRPEGERPAFGVAPGTDLAALLVDLIVTDDLGRILNDDHDWS